MSYVTIVIIWEHFERLDDVSMYYHFRVIALKVLNLLLQIKNMTTLYGDSVIIYAVYSVNLHTISTKLEYI